MFKDFKKVACRTLTEISTGSANNFMQDKQPGKTREPEEVDSPVPSQPERSIPLHGDNRQPLPPPDYNALQRVLQEASQAGYDDLHFKAEQLKSQIPSLTMKEKGNFSPNIRRDENSQKLLPASKLKGEYVALHTTGDGNCLFRAASILAYGNEDKHQEMRVRIVVELLCNRSYYLNVPYIEERIRAQELFIQGKSSHKGRGNGQGELNKPVLEVAFEEEVRETCKDATWASDWHLQALATVLRHPLKIVFAEGIRALERYFGDNIHPRVGYSMLDPLVILWTSTGPLETTGLNHFVPLVPADEVHSLGKNKSGSASTTDVTDSKEDQNAERNTNAKQSRNKQPSEQDEKGERRTKTRCEPINQLQSKERRPSLPLTLFRKAKGTFSHSSSDPCLSPGTTEGKPKLGDRINNYLRNDLDLVERLARCLDREYHHGIKKCWKHLAEHLGVKEKIYDTFKCSSETSPTVKLLEYLNTRYPVIFTIRVLKGGLAFIKRRDVIKDVLEKHQESDKSLTDETTVGSLFGSHPGVIEEMASSLDLSKPGNKNWRHLADILCVERRESRNFTKTIEDNPAKILLEVVETKYPKMTFGDLIEKLSECQLEVVAEVLTNCKEVTSSTLLRDLWDVNDEAADNLCNHLNHEGTATRRAWRILGHKLKIAKEHLDSFSTTDYEVISPMEKLVNHLGGARPELTFKEFIEALYSIERGEVVEDCFPDLEMQYKDFLKQSQSQSAGGQIKPTTSFMETTI